jgi:hypothetical protein
VILRRPCLSLLWLVQPDALGLILGEDSLHQSGFLPRCLLAHTHAEPQRIEGEPSPIPESVRHEWGAVIEALLTTYRCPPPSATDNDPADERARAGTGLESPLHVRTVEPTAEARAVLIAYFNETVDARRGEMQDISSFAARWGEQAWRLALVIHAAFHGPRAHEHRLDVETAENAILIARWFARQQVNILGRSRRQAATKLEDEVLELLDATRDRKGQDFVTARDVQRARIVAGAAAAHALLDRMEREGLLSGEPITPTGGGKTTRIYRRVNNPLPA